MVIMITSSQASNICFGKGLTYDYVLFLYVLMDTQRLFRQIKFDIIKYLFIDFNKAVKNWKV